MTYSTLIVETGENFVGTITLNRPPANALGMGSAWINRHVEPTPPGATPGHVWRDLWGLAAFAGGAGPGVETD